MLASLRKLSPKARETVLARLAQELLPNPKEPPEQVGDQKKFLLNDETYRTVLNEICSKTNVDPNVRSAESDARILRFLFDELRTMLLDSSRIRTVRARVGQRGFLSSSRYDVATTRQFLELNATLGLSEKLARATIANPDFVEHLLPETFGQVDGIATSLFVSNKLSTNDPYSVLVLTTRKGEQLVIDGGWLIFHRDLASFEYLNALDLLRAFTEHYGFEVSVGSAKRKFILYESFVRDPAVPENAVMRIDHPPGVHVDSRLSFRLTSTLVEVAVAFALDVARYIEDLKAHGVNVTRKLGTVRTYQDVRYEADPDPRG